MSTSGVSTLSISRDDICLKALKKCGQAAEGETVSAEQMSDTAADLNRMIKGFQADGVKLWTQQELVLFLTPETRKYSIGPNGANCVAVENLIATSSTATAMAGDTSIELASVAGVLTGMTIGILCDDNSLFWTTISMPPAGNIVTFLAPLTVQATSSPNVWIYKTAADRPLRIEQARVQTGVDSELTLRPLSRSDYFAIPNKDSEGTINSFYYNPSLNTGTFYAWPLCPDSSFYLNLTAYRPLQIFVKPTDTLDMPDEDQQGIIWALAREIAPEYGVDQVTMNLIMTMAQGWIDRVEKFDVEEASVIFMPDFQ